MKTCRNCPEAPNLFQKLLRISRSVLVADSGGGFSGGDSGGEGGYGGGGHGRSPILQFLANIRN